MAGGKDRSLGELEALYMQKMKYWTDQRAEIVARLSECDQSLKAYDEKLRWVRTLIVAPEGTVPLAAPRGRKRRRKSPVKEVTYGVLRDRPGQWLTASQILTAIRKDTHKRVSRQAVNVNLNVLEKAGRVQRRPAPQGSGGAQFVFSAK